MGRPPRLPVNKPATAPASNAAPAELVDILAAGVRVKYLHFWDHKPQPDGSVGPGCLSQWWPAPFVIDGREYATAEHWMMWSKTILFDDNEIGGQILAASHPHRAKALGRQVRGFDQAVLGRAPVRDRGNREHREVQSARRPAGVPAGYG